MNQLSVSQFAACCGASMSRASARHSPYMAAMAFYHIDTERRVAMFLANVGHECGGFQWPAELWGPTAQQRRYERDFSAPWPSSADDAELDEFDTNRLAWRLGNAQKGDGSKYRGGGDIQTTGRTNFAIVTRRLRSLFPSLGVPDFEAEPERIREPQWAALSACDYADRMKLNNQADLNSFDHYCDLINRGRITAAVGDSNGYADRMKRLRAAYAAIGIH